MSLGFNSADLRRVVWTFVAAAVASFAVSGGSVTKTALLAAIAAGISAVKNFVLADGSPAK